LSWSPDGQRIAYAAATDYQGGQEPTSDIVEVSARTGQQTMTDMATWTRGYDERAPRTPEIDYAPTNLQNYVFATNAGDPGRTGRLWVFNRAGTYRKQASTDNDVRTPVYSPDGRQVLYAQHTRGQQPRLRLVSLPSSTPKTVLTNAAQPDWQRVR
jgi:Tol biopolymer transport system component